MVFCLPNNACLKNTLTYYSMLIKQTWIALWFAGHKGLCNLIRKARQSYNFLIISSGFVSLSH